MTKIQRHPRREAPKERSEYWIEGDELIICRPCAAFSHNLQVPKKLEKNRVGNFGIFQRDQAPAHLKHQLKNHEEKALHIWCLAKEQEEKTTKTNWEIENKKQCWFTNHSKSDLLSEKKWQ